MRAREWASGRKSPKCVDDQAALAHRLELPHRPFEELPWGESIHIHDKDHIGLCHREEQAPLSQIRVAPKSELHKDGQIANRIVGQSSPLAVNVPKGALASVAKATGMADYNRPPEN